MSKPTPGPWRRYYKSKIVAVKGPPGEIDIVKWPGFDDSDRPLCVHAANARLIAAAPDLLNACKWLYEACMACDIDGPQMDAARRAIAKATSD